MKRLASAVGTAVFWAEELEAVSKTKNDSV